LLKWKRWDTNSGGVKGVCSLERVVKVAKLLKADIQEILPFGGRWCGGGRGRGRSDVTKWQDVASGFALIDNNQ